MVIPITFFAVGVSGIMFITVVLLIVIVQVFQSFGNWATKRSDRRIS